MNKFQDFTDKIVRAAENPKYRWRTVQGIATETGVSQEVVAHVLSTNTDTFIQAGAPSKSGESLFTTRKRYLETATPSEKFLGALKNRLS